MQMFSYRCLIFFVGMLLLFSCDNASRNKPVDLPIYDNPITATVGEDDRGGFDSNSSNLNIGNIRLTGYIETCNKCMGYGSVQDGLYGQPQICKFCWISTYMRIQQGWTGFNGRYGQVDAVFNTLPSDYFDGLDWNDGGNDINTSGTSSGQIELEIARHEENIVQLEHQLEYIEGSITRTQIEQQIIEEQYEIRRLKAILNDME